MASQGGGKTLRDKEVSAMTYNMKEQRVLEKSLQTLKLEQTYSMKLLELDNRIIKVHYKKLKEKVSKIKSHLPAEDISKFRELDQQGKLKPHYGGMSLSSAVKIAAAHRRLNLNNGKSVGRRTVRSALPRISVQTEPNNLRSKSSVPNLNTNTCTDKIKRSNSVTGAFIDAPEPNRVRRPGTASLVPYSNGHSVLMSPPTDRNETALSNNSEIESPMTTARQDTFLSVPDTEAKMSVSLKNGHDHNLRSVSAFQRSHSPFSSHTTAEKDARAGLTTAPAHCNRTRRLSHVSHDSIDSNLGDNLYEERRQELLEEESVRAATLERKTKMFLKDVDDYLQKNPPLQASHVAFENPPPQQPDRDSLDSAPASDANATSNLPPRFQRRNKNLEFDDTPTFMPEYKYNERLLSLWKDMNKVRYLRVPDEKIDLSGINTLAKDQMKLFDALRQADRPPLRSAWET